MQGMSEREYSAHSKISRGAIQKAKRNGRMVLFSDGSINAAASDARRAGMTDPDQQRRSVASSESSVSGPAESSSYLKARTALTVYQAQERQLSIQKKKGALVDRARAETLVFRLARQERDVWVTWPARVAALMTAPIFVLVPQVKLRKRLDLARDAEKVAWAVPGSIVEKWVEG